MTRTELQMCAATFAIALICAGCFGGHGSRHVADAAAVDAYSHSLHNRFYNAWVQPKTVGASRGKVSVPVDLEIDRTGRVLIFQIAKPSGHPAVDASIEAVAAKVRKVDRPPISSGSKNFALRIYFELDVK